MAKVKTLEQLFEDEIKDLLNAEKQLISALPKMAKNAESEKLKELIEEHLEETRTQVTRLEQVFEEMGKSAKGKKCDAMEGIITEAKSMMEEMAEDGVMDAGIIAAAQKAEHYEIASYGTVITWAQQLGFNKSAELLKETLEEEKNADKKLSRLALSGVNKKAKVEEE